MKPIKIPSLLLLPIAILLFAHPLQATGSLTASPADATPQNNSPSGEGAGQSVRDKTKGVIRVGSFETDLPDRRCVVLVFTLPDAPAPANLKAANFSIRLFSKRFAPDYDLDLYALRVAPPEEEAVQPTDYGVVLKPEEPKSQVLLEASFATPSSPDQRLTCSTDAAALLAKFLKDHWIPGGKLFVRINAAKPPNFGARDDGGTIDQGYDFGSADQPNEAERPTLEIAP